MYINLGTMGRYFTPKLENIPKTEICGCATSRERRIVVMSVYYISQTRHHTWGSFGNASIPSEPHMVVGMQLARYVTRFFASGSTAKTDHEIDELMLHNDKRKNPENICADTLG